MPTFQTWLPWALASAAFAALTAIFAKIGLQGVDSDFATLVRTIVIVAVLGIFVSATGKWQNPIALPRRSLLFLVLSALATGASWVAYFRALKLGPAVTHAVLAFRPGRPATVLAAAPVTTRAASAIRCASARSAVAPSSVNP